ncbi:hypothetical protein AMECASPLE_032536 [Ameca splendens]|uniref:CARD domain-containing protein n=1 Tax=Ameca splendens TaxID=208324 RepID=A0ABV0YU91_9TELE
MTGFSRQMTQFATEVSQQLAWVRDDLGTCNERLSRLESKASCSEELQRKRRRNNPKIAEAVRLLHTSNSNFSRYDPRQGLCSPSNAEVPSERPGLWSQAQSNMVWIMSEQARNAGLTTSADAVSNAGASQQAGPQSSNDASSNGQRFVDKYRIELTNRVGNIGPILDKLLVKNVIRDETYGQINAKSTKVEKIRALYDGPLKGGTAGKDIFYSILKG